MSPLLIDENYMPLWCMEFIEFECEEEDYGFESYSQLI